MSITILTKTERIDQWNKWVEQAPKGIKDYFLMIEMDAQRWEIAENQEILTESQLEEVNTIYKEDAS
jgi:hypothetical protein